VCGGTVRYLATSCCCACELRRYRERRNIRSERPGHKQHGAPCPKDRQHRDENGLTLRYVVGGRCCACERARANAAYRRKVERDHQTQEHSA
jgi:hypothetical protein